MTVVRTLLLFLLMGTMAHGQTCWQTAKQGVPNDTLRLWQSLRNVPHAAKEADNLKWELPVAVATGVFIGTGDSYISRQVQASPTLNHRSNTASSAIVDGLVGAAGATYLVSCFTSHQHAAQAGFTALAAVGLSLIGDEALKVGFNRQRPAGRGSEFWEAGNSFPSGHTVAAWAAASSLAHSYPQHRWMKWALYATAVSVAALRISAHQHFPSDVLIGGTLGYLVGARLNHP